MTDATKSDQIAFTQWILAIVLVFTAGSLAMNIEYLKDDIAENAQSIKDQESATQELREAFLVSVETLKGMERRMAQVEKDVKGLQE